MAEIDAVVSPQILGPRKNPPPFQLMEIPRMVSVPELAGVPVSVDHGPMSIEGLTIATDGDPSELLNTNLYAM